MTSDKRNTSNTRSIDPCAKLRIAGAGPCGHGTHLADLPCRNRRSAACQELARSRLFMLTLVLVTALGPLAMSSFVPAIPAIQQTFSVSGSVAQLTLSASMLAMALASLAYGSLADRFGRRPVLLAGIAVGSLGSLVCAAGPNIETVILGRALQAAGASAGFVLARVVVRDVYGDERSASVLAYVTAAMTLAPMIGPIIGGYLVDTTGWRAIFLTVAIVAAGLFLVVAARFPETRSETAENGRRQFGSGYRHVLQNSTYLKFLAYGTMSQAAFFGFVAGAPYLMSEVLGYPATVYGFYFLMVPIGYFIGSLIAGKYGKRLSHEASTLFGAIAGLFACALGLLWVAGAASNPLALFIPAALLSVASGIALPGAQAGMLAAAGEHAGAGSGLFSFVQLLASAIAAQLVGGLQSAGPTGLFSVMVAASALALVGYAAAAGRSSASVN
jgi:DHA1 family bicyclomycin/chloramphenicol resistance-like MFS transporter